LQDLCYVPLRRVLVGLCLLLPVALPDAASAAHAERAAGGVLTVTGGSETNGVTVALASGNYMVTDSAGMDEGPGCSNVDATTSSCSAGPVTAFSANLGAGDDGFSTTAPIPVRVAGGPGDDDLGGGPMADTLIAETNPDDPGTGRNTLSGGGGNDNLFGGGGPDIVRGGVGNDGVAGAGGEDMVDGEEGDDSVSGGPGRDTLFGSAGNDSLNPGNAPAGGVRDDDLMSGGDGIDEVTYASRTAPVVVTINGVGDDGAQGENDNVLGDVEKVTGGTADDQISGSAAAETLNGGPGADTLGGGGGVDDLEGGDGDDTMDGGPGADLIAGGSGVDGASYLANGFQPITVALDAQPGDGEPFEGDNVQPDVENVATGEGSDTLSGSDGANTMAAGGGEDYADGGAGPDVMQMGAGIDVVRARDGVADTVDCGPSSDFAIVDPSDIVAPSCERLDKGSSKARFRQLLQLRPLKGGEAFGLKGMHRTVPLRDVIGVPLGGTKLDATAGSVRLTAARGGGGGGTFSGDFSEGAFLVKQPRSGGGLTELTLTGGATLSKCPSGSHAVQRRLFGRAHGRFRSRGRFSTATVRGTEWTVADRCDGTLTTVKKGSVRVRDLVRKRTVTLKSGRSYLARRGNR
jgi:Ca2+-binding RTX toxin-like protein